MVFIFLFTEFPISISFMIAYIPVRIKILSSSVVPPSWNILKPAACLTLCIPTYIPSLILVNATWIIASWSRSKTFSWWMRCRRIWLTSPYWCELLEDRIFRGISHFNVLGPKPLWVCVDLSWYFAAPWEAEHLGYMHQIYCLRTLSYRYLSGNFSNTKKEKNMEKMKGVD